MAGAWWKTLIGYIISLIGILLLWQLVVVIFSIPKYLLPDAWTTLQTIWIDTKGAIGLLHHTWVTTLETVLGLLLAVVVGVPIAIVTTLSKRVENSVYPLLVVTQVVPKVAIAPIAIVWLGTGLSSKVLIAFLIAFFVIIIDVSSGLSEINPNTIQLGRAMGGSTWQIYRRIRLPNALPNFFASLKVGVTLALVGAVVGELVGAQSGLGYLVTVAFGQFDLPLMFAAVVLMSGVGIVLFGLVRLLELWSIPWAQSVRVRSLGVQ